MTRFLLGILMFLASLMLAPILLLPLAILYAFAFFAPELIVLGALIDLYFNYGQNLPLYMIGASIIVVLAEFIKPRLSLYSS